MSVRFVEVPPQRKRGRHTSQKVLDLVDALRSNPGKWAVVEQDVKVWRGQVVRGSLARVGEGFEVTYRQGTVYARYAPMVTTEG